jgi:YggT family protein
MMTNPILALLLQIVLIYEWVVIATVILSWLMAFNVINLSNSFVRQGAYVLEQLTEPFLRPIRRSLPNLGGVDLSPVVLLLCLWFLRYALVWAFAGY